MAIAPKASPDGLISTTRVTMRIRDARRPMSWDGASGAGGEAWRGKAAKRRLGDASFDAAGNLVEIGEGARGEDVLRRAVEIERAA